MNLNTGCDIITVNDLKDWLFDFFSFLYFFYVRVFLFKLSCSFRLSTEAVNVDVVRSNIDLVQTEWDVCTRELEAARDRVHTQTRVRAISVQLADLDQALEGQDQWLETTSAVEKCNEVELRNLSGECRVRFAISIPFTLISFV